AFSLQCGRVCQARSRPQKAGSAQARGCGEAASPQTSPAREAAGAANMAAMTLPITTLSQAPFDERRLARSLYWRGWSVAQISEELHLKRPTVASWKQRDKWDDAPSIRKLEDCLEVRFMTLVMKEKKTGSDFK